MTAEPTTLAWPPLTRRSPLAGWAERLAAAPVSIVEEPFAAHTLLRLDPHSPVAARLEDALGLPLPVANRRTGDARHALLWLGPDEYLLTDHPATPPPEPAFPSPELVEGATATDVSDQRTTLRLRGRQVRSLLAHGCALDLHPRSLPADTCAQTLLGQVPVLLVVLASGPAEEVLRAELDARLLVRASFARHVAGWLLDAAQDLAPLPS